MEWMGYSVDVLFGGFGDLWEVGRLLRVGIFGIINRNSIGRENRKVL